MPHLYPFEIRTSHLRLKRRRTAAAHLINPKPKAKFKPKSKPKPKPATSSAMDRLLSAPKSLAQSVLVALCDDTRIQARALRYLGALEEYAAQRATVTSNSSFSNNSNKNNNTTDAAACATASANNNSNNKSSNGDRDRSSGSNANPLKRKSPMEPGQICLQCTRAFTPSSNTAESCLYHPGELELIYEHTMWDDWDENVGGPMDSDENREDHPEGFLWGKH